MYCLHILSRRKWRLSINQFLTWLGDNVNNYSMFQLICGKTGIVDNDINNIFTFNFIIRIDSIFLFISLRYDQNLLFLWFRYNFFSDFYQISMKQIINNNFQIVTWTGRSAITSPFTIGADVLLINTSWRMSSYTN